MRKSPDADVIIDQARTWLGTPYHHQAQLKGVGVDCVGLVLGVGKETGFMDDGVDDRFKAFAGYSRVPNPRRMLLGMEMFLERPKSQKPRPGAIGWFQWRQDLPMHLAIFGYESVRLTMIHAYSSAGKCVEHTVDATWLNRLNSVWQYPRSEL